jgi:hypothetical protein
MDMTPAQVADAWFAVVDRVDDLLQRAGSDGLSVYHVAEHLDLNREDGSGFTFAAAVLVALLDNLPPRVVPLPVIFAGYGDGSGPAPSWAVPAFFEQFAAAHFPNRLEYSADGSSTHTTGRKGQDNWLFGRVEDHEEG